MTQLISLSGPLTFETVPSLLSGILEKFQRVDDAQIDCSGITACNSAALALFVELVKEAEKKKIKIAFLSIPNRIIKIADTCGIRCLIGDHL